MQRKPFVPFTAVLYPSRPSTMTSAPSEMELGAALRASAISAVRSIRYCSIGAMVGYGIVASRAIAWYAVPSTTSSAKLLIAIAPTFFFRIVFLLRMGLFLSGRPSACSTVLRAGSHPIVVAHGENRQ